jgi:hypothetical protein
VFALLVAGALALQFDLLGTRAFDADEFQHAHSAFLISKGQVPYRDYFEHHPPLLHFLMAEVIGNRQPERDGASANAALLVLRTFCWFFTLIGAAAHALLARRSLGGLGAGVASLLLWSTLIVFEKSIEIRPDTAAFACLQLATLILCREGEARRTALAFSLLGAGLLFTQKLLFPVLGLIAVVWFARPMPGIFQRLAIVAGLAAPTLLCAVWFLTHDALPAFIEDVFLINARWKARVDVLPFLVTRILAPSALIAVLGLLGLLVGTRRLLAHDRSAGAGREDSLIVVSAWGGVLGLVLLPVAWEQYYLLLLPQLAILGAGVLTRGAAAVLRQPLASGRVALGVLAVSLIGLIPTIPELRQEWLRSAESKRRAIDFVLENSSPADTVLDGYSGIGVFRPHAFRYFFLHAEMRQMLPDAVVRELESGLRGGAVAPRFVSADANLRAVSQGVRDFLDQNYAPVGVDPVEVRLFPGGEDSWDDARPRLPGQPSPSRGAYVLIGDGWSPRQSEAGRTFRRSRGKSSTLLFPVAKPNAFTILRLSARAGAQVPGLVAVVSLNGSSLGEIALGTAFTSFELSLPEGALVRGLNRLEFSYPRRPAQSGAVATVDENATLALESVALSSVRP